jgi:hypothetical protein
MVQAHTAEVMTGARDEFHRSPAIAQTSKPLPSEPSGGQRAGCRPLVCMPTGRLNSEAGPIRVNKSVQKSNRDQIAPFFDSIDPQLICRAARRPPRFRSGPSVIAPGA